MYEYANGVRGTATSREKAVLYLFRLTDSSTLRMFANISVIGQRFFLPASSSSRGVHPLHVAHLFPVVFILFSLSASKFCEKFTTPFSAGVEQK
jgi:hypothetical protein